jgi:hypothetical protein
MYIISLSSFLFSISDSLYTPRIKQINIICSAKTFSYLGQTTKCLPMNSKKTIIIALLAVFVAVSCKKNKTYCWQLVDAFGNEMNSVCGKTEEEMQAAYPSPCNYYKIGAPKYCWYTSNGVFIKDKPEAYITNLQKCFNFSAPAKVACDYCQTWYTRQKSTFKPTNMVTYSAVHVQQYCGDTVHTLYKGREILVRETADSLITIQFSNTTVF